MRTVDLTETEKDVRTVSMNSNFIGVKDALNKAYHQFLNVNAPFTEEQKLMQDIRRAKSDWMQAENRFNQTTDPDVIDQVIYDMMSAKTRYAYLLKYAKEQNFHM